MREFRIGGGELVGAGHTESGFLGESIRCPPSLLEQLCQLEPNHLDLAVGVGINLLVH
jgi:hypothetical protein